jgi:hypothetical protein
MAYFTWRNFWVLWLLLAIFGLVGLFGAVFYGG